MPAAVPAPGGTLWSPVDESLSAGGFANYRPQSHKAAAVAHRCDANNLSDLMAPARTAFIKNAVLVNGRNVKLRVLVKRLS